MRVVYAMIGLFFVGLGLVGMFLPVLPTTPFLLIALWAFSKSSKRLENWLLHHRVLGPLIDDWHRYRVIPLYAKLLAWSMMVLSLLYLIFFTDVAVRYVSIAGVTMLIGAFYIGMQPSKRKNKNEPEPRPIEPPPRIEAIGEVGDKI